MITEKDAADAINYLLAAQAISVVDGQAAVWADYLNAEAPKTQPRDLLQGCRDAIKTWSRGGRSWKIDVDRLAFALKAIRSARIDRAQIPEPPTYLGIEGERDWRRRVTDKIGDGLDPERAADVVRRDLGLPEPPPLIDKPVAALVATTAESTRPRSSRSGVSA